MRGDERVLHLAFRNPVVDGQGLSRALATLGELVEIDWREAAKARFLDETVLHMAAKVGPTLVFLELRGPTPRRGGPTPQLLRRLRDICGPSCVVVVFYGDQFHEPADPHNTWLLELARAADVFLVCNTRHPAEYARLGVPRPGYLQAGFDNEAFQPRTPAPGAPRIAFMGTCHTKPGYHRRNAIVGQLAGAFPGALRCFGFGWEGTGVESSPFLAPEAEAAVYAGARAALCMSIRSDLPRYTSDRLFRAIGSGAVCLVEAFPDVEGLGLEDGVNCLLWRTWEELRRAVERCLDEDLVEVRLRAVELAHEHHTWVARMPELAAVVEAVRQSYM